ncbi:unnamed protein product, partial [Prorocentrum cordatum]
DLYWQHATGLWKKVLDGLNEGRAASVKAELSGDHCQEAAPKVIGRLLEDLSGSQRGVASSADPKTCGSCAVATLVDVLLRLIGGFDAALSWDGVRAAVRGGET